MTAPTLTASLNKASYTPGELMILTVAYFDPDTQAFTVTVSVADSQGNTSDPVSVSAVIDPTVINVIDSSGRTWTKTSDTGGIATFTATA